MQSVSGLGASALHATSLSRPSPLHLPRLPLRPPWFLKNIYFHGGLWARRIHVREAQRRSPPRIIRITDRPKEAFGFDRIVHFESISLRVQAQGFMVLFLSFG